MLIKIPENIIFINNLINLNKISNEFLKFPLDN